MASATGRLHHPYDVSSETRDIKGPEVTQVIHIQPLGHNRIKCPRETYGTLSVMSACMGSGWGEYHYCWRYQCFLVIFYTTFKGYTLFTLITKYWLYPPMLNNTSFWPISHPIIEVSAFFKNIIGNFETSSFEYH